MRRIRMMSNCAIVVRRCSSTDTLERRRATTEEAAARLANSSKITRRPRKMPSWFTRTPLRASSEWSEMSGPQPPHACQNLPNRVRRLRRSVVTQCAMRSCTSSPPKLKTLPMDATVASAAISS